MKLKFRVFDQDDNDITHKHEWYLASDGNLYIMTNEINGPLMEAEDLPYIDKSIKSWRLQFYYE
jgi:hypothetical protein